MTKQWTLRQLLNDKTPQAAVVRAVGHLSVAVRVRVPFPSSCTKSLIRRVCCCRRGRRLSWKSNLRKCRARRRRGRGRGRPADFAQQPQPLLLREQRAQYRAQSSFYCVNFNVVTVAVVLELSFPHRRQMVETFRWRSTRMISPSAGLADAQILLFLRVLRISSFSGWLYILSMFWYAPTLVLPVRAVVSHVCFFGDFHWLNQTWCPSVSKDRLFLCILEVEFAFLNNKK